MRLSIVALALSLFASSSLAREDPVAARALTQSYYRRAAAQSLEARYLTAREVVDNFHGGIYGRHIGVDGSEYLKSREIIHDYERGVIAGREFMDKFPERLARRRGNLDLRDYRNSCEQNCDKDASQLGAAGCYKGCGADPRN